MKGTLCTVHALMCVLREHDHAVGMIVYVVHYTCANIPSWGVSRLLSNNRRHFYFRNPIHFSNHYEKTLLQTDSETNSLLNRLPISNHLDYW
jgi:hypothetical protein